MTKYLLFCICQDAGGLRKDWGGDGKIRQAVGMWHDCEMGVEFDVRIGCQDAGGLRKDWGGGGKVGQAVGM